jgi:tetraprenyl-beta-curcumene synthase
MRESAAYALQLGSPRHGEIDGTPTPSRFTACRAVRRNRACAGTRRDLALNLTFGSTVARYLVDILPRATRELADLRARARLIPDASLRAAALDALASRGNMEGAALFAVLAPHARRAETVRALVAFQAVYGYLDSLAEQPSADPITNGRRLHEALLDALEPGGSHADYYAHHPQRDDGGYLDWLVERCRSALRTLPSQGKVAPAAWAAAARIVTFQSLNLTRAQGDDDELERWARMQTPPGSGLQWWQTAGAGGSSLAVHALIATAANPDASNSDVAAIEAAYLPWICALHSMLDSLVDADEDERAGQRNLLSYHSSPQKAAFAMKMLALRATAAARTLALAPSHEVILATMVAYYVSSPEVVTPEALATAANVTQAVGPLVTPALTLFRVRRLVARLRHGGYS